MRKLNNVLFVFGGVVGAVACTAMVAAGCGGDDTQVQSDSGADVIVDRTVSETGLDTGVDSGSDAAPDVLPDVTGMDVQDAGPDVVSMNDGGADAPYDASVFLQFASQVTQAFCTKLSGCCFGADAGAFNASACQAAFASGYDESNADITTDTPRGHSAFNAAAAQACLSDINALGCVQITAAQAQALRTDCFGAVSGTLAGGAPCVSSIECAPGLFCDQPKDGGAATCAPLRTSGGPCGDFGASDPVQSQQACSYRGSATSGLTCQWGDFTTGAMFDAGAWQCVPELAQGSNCNGDPDCTSKICDSNQAYICAVTEAFANATTCQSFSILDAGGD